MVLPESSRIVRERFRFRPFRRAFAPWLPSLFHLRSRVSRVVFYFRACAICWATSGPSSLFWRSILVRERFSPTAWKNF